MDVFHCLTRLRTRKIIWGIGIIGSITLSPGWSGQPPITPQQQQQQQPPQSQSQDPTTKKTLHENEMVEGLVWGFWQA